MTPRICLSLLAAALLGGAVWAQPTGRGIVAFTHARIVSMAGPIIADGTIIVRNGQITQVGQDVEIPDSARVVDLKGATVTPGLIDADGALGLELPPVPREAAPDATNRAFDALDRFAAEQFRDALRNGVTSVYLPAINRAGITGGGAVIRLKGGDDGGPSAGEVVREPAALCIDLGSGDRPVERLQTFEKVHKAFRAAIDHRESLAAYKEELEEYEKKVKERADKVAKEEKKPGEPEATKPTGGEKPADPPKPGAASEDPAALLVQPEQPPDAPKDAKPDDKKPDKKDEELKKPTEPRRDPQSVAILRAIDREVPVRVRAQRSADILSAVGLAKEFSLDMVIEGGAEAPLVAEQLEAAEIPVVLGRIDGRGVFRDDQFNRKSPDAPAALSRAGVKWIVGTGAGYDAAEPASRPGSRFVLLNAQLAASTLIGRSDAPDPLQLVTAAAADFLGVQDKIGRIKPGLAADLVVWSGDPLDPASTVERVYVGGEMLYRSPRSSGSGVGDSGGETP